MLTCLPCCLVYPEMGCCVSGAQVAGKNSVKATGGPEVVEMER